MMIYMILITKLADLLMLDAIFLQGVAFTFAFDHEKLSATLASKKCTYLCTKAGFSPF